VYVIQFVVNDSLLVNMKFFNHVQVMAFTTEMKDMHNIINLAKRVAFIQEMLQKF
jgi:hypothetical protein